MITTLADPENPPFKRGGPLGPGDLGVDETTNPPSAIRRHPLIKGELLRSTQRLPLLQTSLTSLRKSRTAAIRPIRNRK